MWITISILTLFSFCFLIVLKNRIETYVPEIIFLKQNEKDEIQINNNNYDFSSYYVNKKRKNVYDNRNKIRKPTGLLDYNT